MGFRKEKMEGLTYSLIIGFLLGSSAVWVTSLINDLYIEREKNLSRLLVKRVKKD